MTVETLRRGYTGKWRGDRLGIPWASSVYVEKSSRNRGNDLRLRRANFLRSWWQCGDVEKVTSAQFNDQRQDPSIGGFMAINALEGWSSDEHTAEYHLHRGTASPSLGNADL